MIWLMLRGWHRGLVSEVATLCGVLLGIWATTHLTGWISEVLSLKGENAVLIAFFVAFAGAMVLCFLLGELIVKMMKKAHISHLNRIAGAALGLIKALCILAVLLNNLVMIDRHEVLVTPKLKEESMLYKPVWNTGNRLTASLKQFIDDHKEEWKEACK